MRRIFGVYSSLGPTGSRTESERTGSRLSIGLISTGKGARRSWLLASFSLRSGAHATLPTATRRKSRARTIKSFPPSSEHSSHLDAKPGARITAPFERIQTISYERDFFTGRSEGQKEQSRAVVGSRCRPRTPKLRRPPPHTKRKPPARRLAAAPAPAAEPRWPEPESQVSSPRPLGALHWSHFSWWPRPLILASGFVFAPVRCSRTHGSAAPVLAKASPEARLGKRAAAR